MSSNVIVWVVAATLLGAVYVATAMVVGGDRRMLLIGKTTDAHHQIEMSCETCHAASAFAGAAAAEKALNKTCRKCHEDELKAADDSHPRKKFRNPRMAAYWEKLDARLCTSCHLEHRPEITRTSAVTVAMDFCVACHSEGDQDVRWDRPSHADLTFDTCASAGCHNYHDNRALYEDFLVEHAGGPALAPSPVHALTARHRTRESPAEAALARSDAVAPVAGAGRHCGPRSLGRLRPRGGGSELRRMPRRRPLARRTAVRGRGPLGRRATHRGLRGLPQGAGEDLRTRPARHAPPPPARKAPRSGPGAEEGRARRAGAGADRRMACGPAAARAHRRRRGPPPDASRCRSPGVRLRHVSPAP